MSVVVHLETISEMQSLLPEAVVHHPMVAVIDFSKYREQIQPGVKFTFGCYAIMFKNTCTNAIKYGQQTYDFKNGSLMCVAPRQVISFDESTESIDDISGWGVFFHPDLIRGTTLGAKIKDYSFFSYETHEALHLSEKERGVLNEIVQKIDAELLENIDKYSQTLIVSNIELLLNYCTRYYDRQFITRHNAYRDLIARFDSLLTDYFRKEDLGSKGLPTVKYLAEQVHLSPGYLSDLLKRETGMNTQEHIHFYLIEEAKNLLLSSDKTVGELAFALGFEYPQYFSRLFKLKTGMTPVEYRSLN